MIECSNSDAWKCPPQHERCRTRAIGQIRTFADCLTEDRPACSYAVAFAHGVLCFHPHWRDFLPRPRG